MNGYLESAKTNRFNAFILSVLNLLFASKEEIYDFSCQEPGINYFFDPFNQGIEGYLTSQGEKIKPGVFILLPIDKVLQTYEVKEVSFYASPADMWTAHLVKTNK